MKFDIGQKVYFLEMDLKNKSPESIYLDIKQGEILQIIEDFPAHAIIKPEIGTSRPVVLIWISDNREDLVAEAKKLVEKIKKDYNDAWNKILEKLHTEENMRIQHFLAWLRTQTNGAKASECVRRYKYISLRTLEQQDVIVYKNEHWFVKI